MPIQFNVSLPVLIFLILALAGSYFYFWWCHRRTMTDMGPGRKRLALAIRLIIVTLLFLALAQMRWVKRNDKLAVIFALDASRSVRPEQREQALQFVREALKGRRPTDLVGFLTFGADPIIDSMPALDSTIKEIKHAGPTNATNIAEALDAGLATKPRDSAAKVVVISDGNENVDNSLAHVTSLAAAGVKVDTVALPSPLRKEALISKLVLPTRVKIGEPFTVKIITEALNAQRGRLVLRRDGQPLGTARDVDIPAGKRVHDFEVRIERAGFYKFEAQLETDPQLDTILENNRGLGFITVRGKPQILYVSPSPDLMSFLQKSLGPQNIDIHYANPAAMPTTAAAFQQFDSVILSDVSRDFFTRAQMAALQASTRDFGVGFGMIGGENSFGAGGYRNTPIEEMLPVSLEVKKQKRMPSVAVALVIEDLEIPASVNMSKEASKALIELLDPMDEVGVLDCANGSSGTWRIKMQHVVDRAAIQSAIDGLDNMGDPPSYDPFLIEAARALQASDAKIKHMVFLGDGDAIWESNQGGMRSTLQQIRNLGITVSTVATAADQNGIAFMADIARTGGGHSYVADKPEDLPRILLKDQQTISAPPIIEEPFIPRHMPGDDVVRGIDAMPQLLGYNIATPKPTSGVSLTTHRNDPLLATWRYGLGRSMAFMSDDKNKWAAPWLPWSGFGQFWAQAIRWTMRSFAPSDFQTQVTMEGTRGHIAVDAIDKDGKFVNGLDFRSRVVGPDLDERSGPTSEVRLRQTAPGHYEAWFDAAKTGTYLVNITRDQKGGQTESTITGLVVPYSPEYRDLAANEYLLTQIAQVGGGSHISDPAAVFQQNRPTVFSPIELYRPLILIAMLLFPFDVAVRRLALQREDFERLLAWSGARAKRDRGPKKAATPELARLMNARERAMTSPTADAAEPSSTVVWNAQADTRVATAERPSTRTSTIPRRPATPTIRPESTPVATQSESPAPATAEDEGMGRLLAAKRRAREQQQPKKDE